MPTKSKYSKEEQAIVDNFADYLRVGIGGVESSSTGGHKAQNPTSTAAGKYQFLKVHLPDIQKYAKKNGMNVPKDMNGFKNQPILQDAFFMNYAKTFLYPRAKTSMNGKNPLNLSLTDVGATLHYQGSGDGADQVANGVLFKGSKISEGAKHDNMTGQGYLDELNGKAKASGYKQPSRLTLTKAGVDTKTNVKSIKEQFKKREDLIDANNDTSQADKEKQRAALHQEFVNAGHRDIVNEYIEEVNEEGRKHHNLLSVFTNADTDNFSSREQKKFLKINGRKFTEGNIKTIPGSGDARQSLIDFPELNDDFILAHKDGKDYLTLKHASSGGRHVYNPRFKTGLATFDKINKDYFGEGYKEHFNEIDEDLPYSSGNPFQHVVDAAKDYSTKSIAVDGHLKINDRGEFKKKLTISDKIVKVKNTPSKKEVKPNKPGGGSAKAKEADVKEEEGKEEPKGLVDEYFANEKLLNSLKADPLNYEAGKRELPIDAIVGLSMGLIGNDQVKNANIPLRTEDVSQAFKSYTAELAEKTKEGLPVEVEAQMKGLLADAYQGGLESIVRASAGNRATVLGNLGSLEQAKSKGLVSLQVADYEAKDRAFAQYGKAIQYINDFDSRRDIANHGIKYREAKESQMEGKAVAAAGMSKVIESIKYERENGPGSSNDMYRSMLMQNMFGFDPKMPDNGNGDTFGTQSHYNLMNKNASDKQKMNDGIYERYQNLDDNKKSVFDKVFEKNKNSSTSLGLLSHLEGLGAVSTGVDLNNLSEATKTNNYGLITRGGIKSMNGKTPIAQPIAPTEQKIDNNGLLNIIKPSNQGASFNPITPTNITDPNQMPGNGLDPRGPGFIPNTTPLVIDPDFIPLETQGGSASLNSGLTA